MDMRSYELGFTAGIGLARHIVEQVGFLDVQPVGFVISTGGHRVTLARCLDRLERQRAGDAGSWGDEVDALVEEIRHVLVELN